MACSKSMPAMSRPHGLTAALKPPYNLHKSEPLQSI